MKKIIMLISILSLMALPGMALATVLGQPGVPTVNTANFVVNLPAEDVNDHPGTPIDIRNGTTGIPVVEGFLVWLDGPTLFTPATNGTFVISDVIAFSNNLTNPSDPHGVAQLYSDDALPPGWTINSIPTGVNVGFALFAENTDDTFNSITESGVGGGQGASVTYNFNSDPFNSSEVPLPPSALLMGSGLLGLVGFRRFRKS